MKQISYLSAPIHVWWEATRLCNFQCPTCYSSSDRAAPDELSTKEVFNLIDQLVDMRIGYLYILGGEPLLRNDLPEILHYASLKNLPIMLNTNGWFVDEEWAAILSVTVRHLRFSLDGQSAFVHDKIRNKPGSYERVLRGIALAKKAGVSQISVSYTVTKENIKGITDTTSLLAELGVSAVQFGPISNTGRAYENQAMLLDPADTAKVAKLVHQSRKKYKESMNVYSVDGTYDRECTKCVKEGKVCADFMGCTAGRTCLCVDWSGIVRPCLLWRTVEAGSIRQTSLQLIWDTSSLFQKLRRHRGDDEGTVCSTCVHVDVCAGECPMQFENRDFSDPRRKVASVGNHCSNSALTCG